MNASPLLAQEDDDSLWKRSGLRVLDMLPLDDIQAYRQSLHQWESIVRGFRREHNFSLTGGVSQGRWRLRKFESSGLNHEESQAFYYRLQYLYHLPIQGGFGYYLGTSFLNQPYENFKHSSRISLERSYSIPGLNVGFVYDFSPGFRVLLGIDGHLQRMEHLMANGEERKRVTVTTRAWGGQLILDFFYRLTWGLRFEAEYQHLTYFPPGGAEPYGINMGLDKEEKLFGLGFVYHLI